MLWVPQDTGHIKQMAESKGYKMMMHMWKHIKKRVKQTQGRLVTFNTSGAAQTAANYRNKLVNTELGPVQ